MRRHWVHISLALLSVSPVLRADHDDASAEHGRVEFPISCRAEVRPRFERAVAQLHSFGYELARDGFAQVAAEDPECGMAYWGVATTYYHPLWAAPTPAELEAGAAAAERAAAIGAGTERERGWIAAIGALYAERGSADHRTRAGRYRDRLAELARAYPDDHEATIFHALLLLGTAPPTDTTYAQQKQAAETLTRLVSLHPEHPGVAHYLIHALDYPELAHLALDAARRYARIAPSSAHALHMPSHIFVRLGLWPETIASNLDSAGSARALAPLYPETSAFDRLHALDYLEYAYLQTGRDEQAQRIVEETASLGRLERPTMAAVYALAAIPARYALERGDWRAAADLAATLPASVLAQYPYAEAIPAYARALGAAHVGDLARAEASVARLREIAAALAAAPPPGPYDWAGHVRALGTAAAGVLARARGGDEEAVRLLTEAAELEERTGKHPVTPGTALPPRELLADLLLDLGRADEALAAYEATLLRAPNRLRALSGAARAAELARHRERARTLYTLVASLTVPDSRRPEVERARAALAAP